MSEITSCVAPSCSVSWLTLFCFTQGTLQQFVDDFFRCVLCSSSVVPPAVKYFFDFLDEQALRHDNVDEETLHIWKTNRLKITSQQLPSRCSETALLSINCKKKKANSITFHPQSADAFLGEHPEKPTLHLRHPRHWGGGRFTARPLANVHGRLHQNRAQTQQSEFTANDFILCLKSVTTIAIQLLSH